jgi:hypothetical protein
MALIGDAERERAAGFLKQCYLQGRISLEELTERLDVALRARRDSDVRLALVDLPVAWRGHGAVAQGLESLRQGARRVALLVLVWSLWWAASLVLLIGFVASVVATGLSLVNAIAFPAVWLTCTFAARRVARRR